MGGAFRLLRGLSRLGALGACAGTGWAVHRAELWGPVAVAMLLAGLLLAVASGLRALARTAGERRRLGGVRLRELDAMPGAAFEDWVRGRLARAGFACQDLPRTRDYGIDVLAGRGPVRVGVQAKRYDGPVGNHAVQQAIAGAGHHGCQLAAVVTQSRFTAAAREQARSAALRVLLVDRAQLADLPSLMQKAADSCQARIRR